MFPNCPAYSRVWEVGSHLCRLTFCLLLSHEQLLRALAGIPLAQPRASSSSGGWLLLQGWAVSPFLFGGSGVLCVLSCKPRCAEPAKCSPALDVPAKLEFVSLWGTYGWGSAGGWTQKCPNTRHRAWSSAKTVPFVPPTACKMLPVWV